MTISNRYPVMVEMVDDVDKREDGGDEDDERDDDDDDDDKSRDGKGVLEKFFCGSPLQASFNSINCPMPAFELHFLPYSTQFSAKNILELDLQIIKLPSVQVAIRDSRNIVHWCSWV